MALESRGLTLDWKGIYALNVRLGFKNAIKGIDYFRMVEYPLALSQLEPGRRYTILDTGSSDSVFPVFLASMGHIVYATDINERVLTLKNHADKLGISSFVAEVEDVTKLPYQDDFFGRITAISTLEHVLPFSDGDVRAVKEIARTLRHGGQAIITVPYARKFESTWSKSKVEGDRSLVRRYDKTSLYERLIEPSGLRLKHWILFGELAEFSKVWYNSPLCIFAFISPFFAGHLIRFGRDLRGSQGVLLTLEKQNLPRSTSDLE